MEKVKNSSTKPLILFPSEKSIRCLLCALEFGERENKRRKKITWKFIRLHTLIFFRECFPSKDCDDQIKPRAPCRCSSNRKVYAARREKNDYLRRKHQQQSWKKSEEKKNSAKNILKSSTQIKLAQYLICVFKRTHWIFSFSNFSFLLFCYFRSVAELAPPSTPEHSHFEMKRKHDNNSNNINNNTENVYIAASDSNHLSTKFMSKAKWKIHTQGKYNKKTTRKLPDKECRIHSRTSQRTNIEEKRKKCRNKFYAKSSKFTRKVIALS